jgi:hypothetical protein
VRVDNIETLLVAGLLQFWSAANARKRWGQSPTSCTSMGMTLDRPAPTLLLLHCALSGNNGLWSCAVPTPDSSISFFRSIYQRKVLMARFINRQKDHAHRRLAKEKYNNNTHDLLTKVKIAVTKGRVPEYNICRNHILFFPDCFHLLFPGYFNYSTVSSITKN